MTIICIHCGNIKFFETEAEHTLELIPNGRDLLIQAAEAEDWHYAEDSIRDQIRESVESTKRMHADELHYDIVANSYFNPYLSCAVCHSPVTTRLFSEFQPKLPAGDLESEMVRHVQNLKQLKTQRKAHEHNLPVLWQPS